jgi:uncharacterized phage protein gp47/JayE
MQLSLQNFTALVQTMAAAVQGAASSLLDLTVGSVLRAILEANASVALWLQWLIVQVLATTRLATSSGADCDSFGADFGFYRLGAVASTGQVIFSRFAPSIAAFIPVGTKIATADNSQTFLITADETNPAYGGSPAGYRLAANVASITLPATAANAGSGGNVQAGAVGLLTSAVAGVDTVTNSLAFTGGMDAESDVAFRARFSLYLAGLAKATQVAVGAAIAGIQQGLSYIVSENIDQTGAAQPGHFVVTIDDGSGAPPSWLLANVQQAVDAVRPVGSSFAVQGPAVSLANVSLSIATSPGASHQDAVAAVAAAIESYIASLGVGATLNYTRLPQLAYAAADSVANVSAVTLNGGTADLVPALFGVVRAGTVAVA